MNIFGIEINGQNVALAFTIVFLIFVVLNGFVGFLRGTRKSIFYLIVTAVVFGIGFGLMMVFINLMLKIQLGKIVGGLVSQLYPGVTASSTAEDIILGIIVNQFPALGDAFEQGSVSASFVMGLVSFVIKLVYILVILILAFTLFKLIADIIWLIIRPKKDESGVRPKKTFGGRMIGFGIGAFKGAIYSLLIFTLIAGVASVASSALAVADSTNENNTEAVLVLTDNNATLITLDASEGDSSSKSNLFGGMDLEFLSSIVGAYRKSAPGAIFGAVKIKTVPFDEFLFDGVFSFDVQVGDEKVKVKLRQEVETVANAVAKVAEQFDIQDVSLEKLLNIGEEGSEALKGLVDAISDLSILKVAIPVALEIGMYSNLLVDSENNRILEGLFTADQIPELSNAVLSDVKSIGYSLVDARSIVATIIGDSETEKDINTYLNLNPDVVKMLFDEDHLGGLSSIDILAPVGITYLTTLEGIKQSIEEFGLSIEEITNMPEGATWSKEIAHLGDVYVALQDLLKDPETGRVFIDKDNYTSIVDLFTEEKINNFVDVLFTSNVVNNSAGALITLAREKLLPEDYKQYITIGDGVKFDADECKAFLNAATCLVKSGFLSMIGSEGIDFNEILENLNVDDLARYLSQSVIVRSSLSTSLDLILGNLNTGDINLRFGTFEDWDDQASTEVELRSVLKAMKLLAKNLFNESGENEGFSINSLKGLTEAELESILTSQIMRGTIVNFLVDNSGEGQTLSVIGKGVSEVNATPAAWYDQFLIEETATLNQDNLDITCKDKDLDIEYKVDHYLIYCNDEYLTSVRTTAGEDASVDLTKVVIGKDGDGNNVYHTPSPSRTYTAYGVNLRRMGVEKYTLTGNVLSINPAHLDLDNYNNVNKFNVYADNELLYSVRVNASGPLNIDLSTIQVGEDEEHNPIFFEVKEDTKIEVYGYNEGELRKIFKALLAITAKLGEEDLDFSNTDSLTSVLSKVDDEDIEDITTSVVINYALVSAIEDMSKQDEPFIFIPMELKDDLGNLDYAKWQNADESANILRAIKSIFNGGSFDSSNLKLKPIIDNKDSILRSLVISETIKKNIIKIDGIDIPNGEGLYEGSLTGWANTYDEDGNVLTRGELDAMLSAITSVLTIDDNTSINNISTDSLKIKSIIDHRDEILKSKVIAETIRVKLLGIEGISVPSDEENLSAGDLTGWKNIYNEDGSVASRGELSYILNAINYVLTLTDETTINNISTDSIKIKSVIDNSDEILRSLVISETIRVKLLEVDGINIPANEGLSETGLAGWKNTYNADGTVATRAELSALLKAVNFVIAIDENTQIDNISTEAIKLKPIVDNRDEILKSLVISETIRVKLLEVEGIDVPANEGLSETDLEGWKNEYNAAGEVSKHAELSALLIAVNHVLNVTDETTVNNIDTDSIKLKNVVLHADDILRSKVISETIRKKLLEVDGIDIPEGEGLYEDSLVGWKNTYNEDGSVASRAELAALIAAVDVVLNITEETTVNSISTDSIKLKNVITNRDSILKSKVISETIRKKLLEVDGIDIPANEGLSTDGLAGWKNIYNEDGTVATRAELSALLEAVDLVLDITDETTVNNINTDSIKLKKVITNRDKILKSKVISETIRKKLLEVEGIDIPNGEGLSTTDLTGWKNIYNVDETVATRAELSALLEAVGLVLDVNDDTTINNIDTDNIKLKNVIDNKNKILKSLVISETVRKKLLEVEGISIPTGEDLSATGLDGWKNTYNGETLTSEAELSHLLTAVGIILSVDENTKINNIDTDSIKLKSVIDNKEDILKSLVISETIRKKLLEVDGISIPAGEDLSATGLDGWKNTYNGEALASEAELSHLLGAVGLILNVDENTKINNIDTNAIKLKSVIDNKDDILKSLVISETIRVKLLAVDGIEIPANEGLSTTGLDGWKSTYNADGTVASRAELAYLLTSVGLVLEVDNDTTINNIDTDTIKLKPVIDHRDEILKSLVICGTIKTKLLAINDIDIPADEGLSETDLTGWKNTYKADGTVNVHGELSKVLYSIKYIINVDESTTISSINTNSIKLKALIENDDEVLKSCVITNTIKAKLLAPSTGITVPEGEGLSTTNLEGWKNTYNAEEEVTHHGEVSSLLRSVNYILELDDNTSIDSLNVSTIKLQRIINNSDNILRSVVVTNTIKDKLLAVEGLNIPSGEGLGTTTLTGWKNIYNALTEALETRGEISHILAAIDKALEVDENTTLESVNTNDIKVKKLIANRDEILLSLVLADTIRVKLLAVGGVSIPVNDGIAADNLTGWKNTYDNDVLVSHGEISRFLGAIDVMFEPTDDTKIDGLDVNTIKLKHIIDNSDEILYSLVLADTIRVKVCAVETGVNVPTDAGLSDTSLAGWKNTYNEDEYPIAYGELNYLLKAIDEILHPDDSTKLNNIVVSVKLGNIIDGKTVILHSKVISETIKTKIIEASATGTLKLPKNYAVNDSPNYINWNNSYTDTYDELLHKITYVVSVTGELDYLLSSVDDLLDPADRDKEFNAIGTLNYAVLFDPSAQRDIVSSRIISETIINRLEGVAALSIPNNNHINLKDVNDRSDWWNLDTGEIIYFLNSVGELLTDEQKSSLDSFNLDINTIYSTLTDEASRTTLLKSYIISDTLRVNFMNVDALNSVPSIEHAGVDLVNDLDAWYLISADRNTVSHKELWNLIASIKLLLGDNFDDAKTFTLEDLLNNPVFIPDLNDDKVNTNTAIHTFLQSKMIEEVFVGLASSILTGDGAMADYINAPYGGFVWYEYVYTSTYYEDDRYEYDLQTVLESLYQMEAAGLGYSTFSGSAASIATAMQSVDTAKLADAFVISRTFRGSIAKTFNGIFESVYNAAYTVGLYNGHPIDPWDDVKFVQGSYDAPVTKPAASGLLKNNLDTVINNISSVY